MFYGTKLSNDEFVGFGLFQYTSLDEFRNDFVVMCNNAMLYNGSDTIYYKSAEKMLSLGLKMLAKDKLFKLNKSIGVAGGGGSEDDEDDIVTVDEVEDVTPITTTTATSTTVEGATTEVKLSAEPQPRKRLVHPSILFSPNFSEIFWPKIGLSCCDNYM